MLKERNVIVVAGLGDDCMFLGWETKGWRKFGLNVRLHQAPWENNEPFEPKLKRLLRVIDELSDQGAVSLIGVSAGGSLALNAFTQRKATVHRLVTVCAPLKEGKHNWLWDEKMRNHKSFKASLALAKQNQATLTAGDKERILTTHAILDEHIPNSTATIDGVENWVIPMIGHQPAITLALTYCDLPLVHPFLQTRIIKFIK